MKTAAITLVLAAAVAVGGCSSGSSASKASKAPTTQAGTATSSTTPVSTTSTSPGSTTSTTSTTPGAVPTLGAAWSPQVSGFGQAMPSGLSFGGDPTGVVTAITWSGWGQAQATGQGTSTYVGPNQIVAQGTSEPVDVIAFGLGSCGSGPAYQRVEWFFPTEGQSFDPNAYTSVCTGPTGAHDVSVDQATRTDLLNSYVAFMKLPAADITGPTAGSVYDAYDEPGHTYWALASFEPAPGAPQNVGVSMQDGGQEGIFTRDPYGTWTMLSNAGEPFPCAGKTPVPDEVFAVWGIPMVPASSC